jgi:light-regulated signal transduction histidine kinase (bacteriophytochrome)
MPHLWLSDCESLVSHLKNPKDERLENTRLSIDVQGLKQLLWTAEDGTQFDELPDPKIARNAIRWIDTSAMPVDCMTKRMKPESLIPVLNGRLDLTPTAASTMLKIRKQKLRRNKSETRREAEDAYASTTAVAKEKEDSTTFSSENTNVQLH